MEFAKFLKLLRKYKFVLIAVPLIAVISTYLFTRKMPDQYLASTDLATGVIDPSQKILGDENANIQELRVAQQFASLIETMHLGKVIDQVSYSLIIHDFTDSKPFRPKSKLVQQLDAGAIKHALDIFKYKYLHQEPLDLTNKDEAGLESVLAAQGYDPESIKKDLVVYRTINSDFIHLDYTSENPQLSSYTLNTLCNAFIAYTTLAQQKSKSNSTDFLQKLMTQKQDTMNAKVEALKNYKVKNRILDLKEESTSLYSQLTSYRDRKAQAEKDILSYNSAIANIDSRFDPRDRKYLEASTVRINGQVAQTRDRLAEFNKKYVESNFNLRYKRSIDSLQYILDEQISLMSDKYVANPLAGKESLVQEKVKMEITRDMTYSGLRNLDAQIYQLNAQLNRIVPFDATIQSYNRDIEVATKEYVDIQNQYNQSSIDANLKNPIKQVEVAMPGNKLPSKKIVLTLASGAITAIICLLVLFIMYYMDDNIRVPTDLANATQTPVLGQLNLIRQYSVDQRRIGNSSESTDELLHFKNMLRSIRYEVDSEMSSGLPGKVLAITSINPAEGKSLVSMSLASAYAMANKKVLVVDGNFDHPSLTNAAFDKVYLEDFLKDEESFVRSPENNLICLLSNQGGDSSLLEKSNETIIRNKIDQLKKNFDVVIIETQALSLMNKGKEWIQFADKVVAVFEANQSISSNKKMHLDYLRTLNSKFIGLVMNKVAPERELKIKEA